MSNCIHSESAPEMAIWRMSIDGQDDYDVCPECKQELERRFKDRANVDFLNICTTRVLAAANPITLGDADDRAQPITEWEMEKVKLLGGVSMRIYSFDRNFILQLASSKVWPKLRPRGRTLLALLIWRYRRQLPPFSFKEQSYLIDHLRGNERVAFLQSDDIATEGEQGT